MRTAKARSDRRVCPRDCPVTGEYMSKQKESCIVAKDKNEMALKAVAAKPIGRPRTRAHPTDPGVLEAIQDRILAGEAIARICEDPRMPAQSVFWQTMRQDEHFRSAIARAWEDAQHNEVDAMLMIADEATPETVQVAKLRIWARMWTAARRAPKRYGNRIEQVHFEGAAVDDIKDAEARIEQILALLAPL